MTTDDGRFIPFRECDYVTMYCLSALPEGMIATRDAVDGNPRARLLVYKGKDIELSHIYGVLTGTVGPELFRLINKYETGLDGKVEHSEQEYNALVSAWNRCYDIRELENIYQALWFEVDYQRRAKSGEFPTTERPW